jgi:ribonuclease D
LGVELDKSFAGSNWAQRPLHPDQLEYAMDDVRHLLALTDKLGQELAKKGRLAWVVEECARLLDPSKYVPTEPRDAWKNVRRRPTAEGTELARLRELAAERELIARETDQPRHLVLPDEGLVDLAHRGPTEEKALRNKVARRTSPNIGTYGPRWLAAIARTVELPAAARVVPTPEEETVMGLLRLRARSAALEAGVAPSLLMAPMEAHLLGVVREIPADEEALVDRLGIDGWRADVAAGPLTEMLAGGGARVVVREGRAELTWS